MYFIIFVYDNDLNQSSSRNPKSATKNRMLMKFTCMLSITVLDVCAKNWRGILSTILSLIITICLIFWKREINLHRITRNPKFATTNPMLIKLTCMLKVTVVHVCAKNWHRLLSIILNFTITICSIFRKREINLHRITRNPKSATKNPMLIKSTGLLRITGANVCAKNWHGILNTILSLHITICLIFRKHKIDLNH